MIQSAITISLVPEARGGPFVFWDGLPNGCRLAAELGFDAVEIFAPSAAALLGGELGPSLQKHNLKLAALGTGAGWLLHQWHLCHADSGIRKQAREFIRDLLKVGASFGAPAIIGSMQGRVEGKVARGQALAWLAEALEDLGETAQKEGGELLFEPLNRYETNVLNCLADTVEFLDGLQTKKIKILADLFHMNIEEADLPQSVRTAGSRLGHIHFADSNRRAIGFGHLPMSSIMCALREIGYHGYLSGEILPWPDSASAAHMTIEMFRLWGKGVEK